MTYLNISGYHFAPLDNLNTLEKKWSSITEKSGIKGTILLAEEGINVALAGKADSVRQFLNAIREEAALKNLTVKESWSEKVPFRRMRIRIKDEIIMMRVPNVDPLKGTGEYLSPSELDSWYDEGKDFVIIDTRNDYEYKVGTFKNAVDLNIKNFREFPETIKQLAEKYKDKPVVTFCTGGVRCEKATVIMQECGFNQVYQLKDGIVKYLEDTKGENWDGECFVFDDRVAVKKDLLPTDKKYCLACLETLTPEEMTGEKFSYNKYCPHCYEEKAKRHLKKALS